MSVQDWTVTEVLLASLTIVLLICTLTIGILLSRLAQEISKGGSKLNSLLTSIDVRIREISEAITALRLEINASKDKEEINPKSQSGKSW
ncbi:MAG TPA: hypothetical protein VFC02_06160 [Anaerolineales bacterium]|nr:hypothetical protein [Anaerolineales bacterium]